MAVRRWAKLALIATLFALAGGFAAPEARAGDGDCVAKLFVPGTGSNYNVAFDGTYLYFSTAGENALRRTLPPGTRTGTDAAGCPTFESAPTDVAPIVGVLGFGIQVLSFDAVSTDVLGKPVFWAVGEGGRHVYKLVWHESADPALPDTVIAELQFVIPDTELEGGCKTEGLPQSFCLLEVDGLAYDAVADLVWYSPEGTRRIYAFETTGSLCTEDGPVECPENLLFPVPVGTGIAVARGYFDVDTPDPIVECQPFSNMTNSGIAIGGPAGGGGSGDEVIAYLFSNTCPNWFRFKADADANAVKQQVYPTFSGGSAEDAECDSETFGKPVVWVRDFVDLHQFHAYEVATCKTGGGVNIPNAPRMTGGGGIPAVDLLTGLPTGDEAKHGLTIHCNGYEEPNQLQLTSNHNIFHMRQLEPGSVGCKPNALNPEVMTIEGRGRGRWNEHLCRKPSYDCAKVRFRFTDAGEPGTFDSGEIEVYYNDVLVFKAAGSLLTGNLPGEGNYQYHSGKLPEGGAGLG